MKAFNGFDDAKKQAQAGSIGRLPAAGYVCKILGVAYDAGTDGKSDVLTIQFDICEGEHADYFRKQYEANTSEDKKWKGVKRIYIPTDDGSERDGWTKKTFAGWIAAVEESNPGYAWDWDEKKLKGKTVGIVFGETGTVIDGKEIVYTEARFGASVEKIRSNDYPLAKFLKKNGYTGNGASSAQSAQSGGNVPDFLQVSDSELDSLPFN